jgi:hypothetical protein
MTGATLGTIAILIVIFLIIRALHESPQAMRLDTELKNQEYHANKHPRRF